MDVLKHLTPELARLLAGALEQKALLLHVGGRLYAAVPYEGLGHWVYELTIGSPEYFVARGGARCTCPVGEDGSCKHATALRGTAVDTANVPWRPEDRRRRKRKRPRGGRPLERGER